MRWNKGLKALPDYSFLFILFFSRLFFTASVVFHCNPPPPPKAILCTYAGGENVGCTFTHSDAVYVACGHHIDSLLWTVFLLLFFFFQQTVWTDAFFFCVEKQCSSLFLLFFFLYVRRYAGHALNLTMFCCKEMHKALCFYDLHPGFFLRKKSSFFLSFFLWQAWLRRPGVYPLFLSFICITS